MKETCCASRRRRFCPPPPASALPETKAQAFALGLGVFPRTVRERISEATPLGRRVSFPTDRCGTYHFDRVGQLSWRVSR